MRRAAAAAAAVMAVILEMREDGGLSAARACLLRLIPSSAHRWRPGQRPLVVFINFN